MNKVETVPLLLKVPAYDINVASAVSIVSGVLKSAHLRFESNPAVLTEEDIFKIYGEHPKVIFYSQLVRYANKPLRVWMVTGRGAISKVSKLKGLATDPAKCAEGTMRHMLARLLDRRGVNLLSRSGKPTGITIVENYVHSPNHAEVVRDMGVFKKFFVERVKKRFGE